MTGLRYGTTRAHFARASGDEDALDEPLNAAIADGKVALVRVESAVWILRWREVLECASMRSELDAPHALDNAYAVARRAVEESDTWSVEVHLRPSTRKLAYITTNTDTMRTRRFVDLALGVDEECLLREWARVRLGSKQWRRLTPAVEVAERDDRQ